MVFGCTRKSLESGGEALQEYLAHKKHPRGVGAPGYHRASDPASDRRMSDSKAMSESRWFECEDVLSDADSESTLCPKPRERHLFRIA